MENLQKIKALFLTIVLLLGLSIARPSLAQDSVIVVNSGVASRSLSKSEIKKLLTGQTQIWPDGQAVVLVLPPKGSAAMDWVCQEILKMPETVYRRYINEKVFRGAFGSTPQESGSDEGVASTVGSTPGAIGPVAAGNADGSAVAVTVQ